LGDRKYMSVKEFRTKGYLQEINRCFLHPLGLALEVILDEETGDERLGGIWDCRDDKERIFFDYAQSDKDRIDAAQKKQLERRWKDRKEALGFLEEPIEDDR